MDGKEEVEKFRKGMTEDNNFHSIWLVSIIGKTFRIRIALWPDYLMCMFHFESSASLDSYHRRPKRTMRDFGA